MNAILRLLSGVGAMACVIAHATAIAQAPATFTDVVLSCEFSGVFHDQEDSGRLRSQRLLVDIRNNPSSSKPQIQHQVLSISDSQSGGSGTSFRPSVTMGSLNNTCKETCPLFDITETSLVLFRAPSMSAVVEINRYSGGMTFSFNHDGYSEMGSGDCHAVEPTRRF